MPPSAASKQPELARVGAGERALLVAEQLALEQRLGERRAVDATNGRRAAPAGAVDRLGDDLLADAGLAEDEHRDRMVGDLVDELVDPAHLRVTDDHVPLQGERIHRGYAERVRRLALNERDRTRPRDQFAHGGSVVGEYCRTAGDPDRSSGPVVTLRARRDQRARGIPHARAIELGQHDRQLERRVLGEQIHRAHPRRQSLDGRVDLGLFAVDPEHQQAGDAAVPLTALHLGGELLFEPPTRLDPRSIDHPRSDTDDDVRRSDNDLVAGRHRVSARDRDAVDPRPVAAAGVCHRDPVAAASDPRVHARHSFGLDVHGSRSETART